MTYIAIILCFLYVYSCHGRIDIFGGPHKLNSVTDYQMQIFDIQFNVKSYENKYPFFSTN